MAERGVGGNEDGRHQRGHGSRNVEQQRGQGGAEPDRDRQAEPEHPGRQGELGAESVHIDADRVGEEQEGQRRLRKQLHARVVERHGQDVESVGADEEAEPDEEHRAGQDRPLDPAGDEPVRDHEGGNERDVEGVHRPSLPAGINRVGT